MIPLFDTHQHLLYGDQLTYPWTSGLPAVSGADFTVHDYRELTTDLEVQGTIFMEVDADDYQLETHLIADLVSEPGGDLRALIASCRPETDQGFDAWLDACAALPVCGFRRILHEVPDDMSTSAIFRRNIQKIGRQSKVFDMVFRADQLSIAYDLAAACDTTALVLDHCGVPAIAAGEFDGWRDGISQIAGLPNVNAKISGVLAYCAPGQATLEAIKPYVDHVIASFGPERLVWGSDWPVVNLRADLPQWIALFRELIAPLSEDEQRAISYRNAERIYGVSMAR